MSENLKTTRYNTGTPIPYVVEDESWIGLSTGAWSYYNHDENNNAIYGKLYNWYAVEGDSLCPIGWHVPTDAEWKILTDYYDGEAKAGDYLKNLNIFAALLGGQRLGDSFFLDFNDSLFDNLGTSGYWWSISVNYDYAWGRVTGGSNWFYSLQREKVSGYSIRCLKD